VRAITYTEPCGCQWQRQDIPRSTHTREIWTALCPAHDAEHKALKAAAESDRVERNRVKALEEEFT
jgi:hypothetical protein